MSEEKRGRGAPPKSILEYARSAYWAWFVRKMARITFAEIERKVDNSKTKRMDGGFGYIQPCAWSKYAAGARACTPSQKGEKSPVVRAERHFPGSRAVFDLFAWEVFANPEKGFNDFDDVYKKISPEILNILSKDDFEKKKPVRDLVLSISGMYKMMNCRHLDALAIMLLQWRGDDRRYLTELDVCRLYKWLMHASRWDFSFRMSRNLMFQMFQSSVPEIADFADKSMLAFDLPEKLITTYCRSTLFTCGQPSTMISYFDNDIHRVFINDKSAG